MMAEAYPLQWPAGWKRTKNPERSRFGRYDNRHTTARARDEVFAELSRLGAKSAIISTNVTTRLDGTPYSNAREPDDAGVAAYFMLDGKEQCIPCDKWNRVADNLWAVAKTIAALRGIERWGAKDMVSAAFRGFQALPDYSDGKPIPGEIDYFADCKDRYEVDQKRKKLVLELHPDKGGSADSFAKMQAQYESRMKVE